MPRRRSPEVCPICGEDVPPNSAACPECGACHKSGWGDDDSPDYGSLDLPDWAYDDEDEKVIRPEPPRRPARRGMNPAWRWVAFGLLLALFGAFGKWIYRALMTPWW